ncbi:hypothetical protein [Roseibium sp.]|uniref:hypothetical protein n=1 Tax=Roseibium sp. TaxID=1936156 RepID=UPI003B4FFAE8
MSSFLWIDQSWWTISGLALDIAGVVLVAKNWPRASLKKQQSNLLDAFQIVAKHSNRSEIDKNETLPEKELDDTVEALAQKELREIRARLDFVEKSAASAEIGFAELFEERTLVLETFRNPNLSDDLKQKVLHGVLNDVSKEWDEKISGAVWDKANTAIFLIVTGFGFQIIGALPL